MKYCPQCNRQYFEAWLTFCTNDGSLLREDLTPAADPNWDPRIREPKFDEPSEQATQWLPPDPPPGGGWIAPDERAPFANQWEPPSASAPPNVKPSPPGLAIASCVVGHFQRDGGLDLRGADSGIDCRNSGNGCAVTDENAPHPTGRSLAIAGIVMGAVNLAFFVFAIIWFALSIPFG